MPMGSPLALEMRVGMAFPLRQSGSKMASTGMMQCWAFFQASLKLGLLATDSVRVVGLTADVGIGCPVRDQSKQAGQGFAIRHSLITNISLFGSANESGWVARPDIVFARVNWRHNTEVFGVAFALLDGLVMTAHGLIVAASLSP